MQFKIMFDKETRRKKKSKDRETIRPKEKLALRELWLGKTQKLQSFGSHPPLTIPNIRSHFLNLSEYSCVVFHFSPMRRCRRRRPESRLLSQSLRVYHARQTALFFAQQALARAFTLEVKDEESVLRFLLYSKFFTLVQAGKSQKKTTL